MFLPTLVKWNGDSVCHLLLTLVQETLKSVEVISNFLTDFYKDKQLNALHFSCALVRSQSTVVKRDIQTKLRWLLITGFCRIFLKADIHYTIKYCTHMQLYIYELLYIIHAIVYACVYWVACGCARVRYDQKGWKHQILEKSSSETIIWNITDLCSTRTWACAYLQIAKGKVLLSEVCGCFHHRN